MKGFSRKLSDINMNGCHVFYLTGKIDSWKTHFTVAQNEAFDTIYEKEMMAYPDLKEKIKFE